MSGAWTCEQVQENAAELALGLTVGPERADALAHLERCDACRALVGDLTRVVDHLLLTGPVEEPPPGFEVRVLERLAVAQSATGGAVPLAATPTRRRHRPRRATPDRPAVAPRRHTARLAALAAAVVLVLAGAVVLVRGRPRTTSSEAVREAPMVTAEGKKAATSARCISTLAGCGARSPPSTRTPCARWRCSTRRATSSATRTSPPPDRPAEGRGKSLRCWWP